MEHVHGVDIYDIYDLTYNPWWLQTWFFVLCGVAVIAAVTGGIYYWYIHRKRVFSYEETLLAQLSALDVTNAQQAQAFYSALTSLLKNYLQYRFGIPSVGYTDQELIKHVADRLDVPQFVKEAASEIVDGVDVIKFAQGQAVQSSMQRAVECMTKIVEGMREDKKN